MTVEGAECGTYHRSKEIRGFLEEVNQTLTSDEWKIHCVRFAPNCPEQNPIEDIWLQAKTWVRSRSVSKRGE